MKRLICIALVIFTATSLFSQRDQNSKWSFALGFHYEPGTTDSEAVYYNPDDDSGIDIAKSLTVYYNVLSTNRVSLRTGLGIFHRNENGRSHFSRGVKNMHVFLPVSMSVKYNRFFIDLEPQFSYNFSEQSKYMDQFFIDPEPEVTAAPVSSIIYCGLTTSRYRSPYYSINFQSSAGIFIHNIKLGLRSKMQVTKGHLGQKTFAEAGAFVEYFF